MVPTISFLSWATKTAKLFKIVSLLRFLTFIPVTCVCDKCVDDCCDFGVLIACCLTEGLEGLDFPLTKLNLIAGAAKNR